MLPTKFCGNQWTGSREDFFSGRDRHLGHATSIMLIHFHFHVPKSLHTQFGGKWLSGF